LWTVALVAPGGFLLVPVLAAASLHSDRPLTVRERFALLVSRARDAVAQLQRYWTKS
jgi:hypothetical protein